MKSSIENYTERLRQKTNYWVVNNDSNFFQELYNPFGKKNVPIMCDFLGNYDFPSFEAYESGNRSILFRDKGSWFKAKGIGIPTGVSRPIYDKGKIYTHQLYDDPGMCHRFILWGFMQKQEFEAELFGAARAKDLGQKIQLLGTASFDHVYYMEVKDRTELFRKLRSVKRKTLINSFKQDGIKTRAYTVFYHVPSDIRVGELFFVFMFPRITELIDSEMIKEYVEWLGSSCGRLLRQFHEMGALHGTWVGDRTTSLGLKDVHSNSYTGNYLVDEEGLTMCDFDLSKPIEKESEKELEKWALVHIENPLYYAGSYTPDDALKQEIAKKNPFREELAKIFEASVDTGYNEEIIEVEHAVKRDMLGHLVKAKELMWNLYRLPKDIVGQIDYVDYVISNTTIESKEFGEVISAFER